LQCLLPNGIFLIKSIALKIAQTTLISIFFFLSVSILSGQAGINIYGGISDAINKDLDVTPSGTSHPGWHLGADARLNEGKMYFIAGLQFHKIKFEAQKDKSFFESTDTYSYTKIRVGLGYSVFTITPDIIFRGHSLLSFNLVNGVPNDSTQAIYTNYNSGVAGANLGLGFDVYNVTLDISYEIGVFNLVNKVKGTSMDFLTVSLGYKI